MTADLDKRIIRALRERQALPASQRSASVAELATELNASEYIISAALGALAGEGLVSALRGPGTVQYALSPMAHAIRAHASAPCEDAQ